MYKILCFLDHDRGRDAEMMLPLAFLAEKHLNARVEYAFVWNVHEIYLKQPDLVLLPNTVGAPLYFEISRYASQCHIPVFALVSEGNFRTDGSFDYWGYNKDQYFYEDKICLWSERTYRFLQEAVPTQKDKMVVTGGVGFDRYRIYEFQSRKQLLEKYGLKHFQKVVGYAGWAFGKLHFEEGRAELLFFLNHDPSRLAWTEEQMYKVEDVLRSAIENNPDTLFILKRHPNEVRPHINTEGVNEMNRLQHYDNVLYIRNEENIHDLINISDLWMGFESTTVLESWLMQPDKPTLFINPEPDFSRDRLYEGTVIAKNYDQLQAYMDEYYDTGKVEDYLQASLKAKREELISATIGYGDGLNHVRAGFYLQQTLATIPNRPVKKKKLSLNYLIKYLLLHIGKYFYHKQLFSRLPKFKKTLWLFERYTLENIINLKNKYYPYLEDFHRKKEVTKILKGKKPIEIVE